MLSQTCARRELAALSDGLGRFAGTSEGILFGRYARLVGAPNCAPSLRSVAGLLLALALESAYEDTPPAFPNGSDCARISPGGGRARRSHPLVTLSNGTRACARGAPRRLPRRYERLKR